MCGRDFTSGTQILYTCNEIDQFYLAGISNIWLFTNGYTNNIKRLFFSMWSLFFASKVVWDRVFDKKNRKFIGCNGVVKNSSKFLQRIHHKQSRGHQMKFWGFLSSDWKKGFWHSFFSTTSLSVGQFIQFSKKNWKVVKEMPIRNRRRVKISKFQGKSQKLALKLFFFQVSRVPHRHFIYKKSL